MKVLFLYKMESFMAPYGLCQMAAVVKQAGHEVYLCELNSQPVLDAVAAIQPDVLAVSTLTGEAKHFNRAIEDIKTYYPNTFCIAGGVHPTFYPEMIHETQYDCLCVGEGEGAMVDVLDEIADHKQGYTRRATNTGDMQTVGNIPNIVTRGQPESNIRPLVDNLDDLPPPLWELVYDNTPLGQTPMKMYMVGRYCPFRCHYCFNARMKDLYKGKGTLLRRHSVDYVIDDLLRIKARWPLSTVKFYDDMLMWQVDEWAEEFVEKYRRHIGLPFFAFTRADLVTDDLMRLFAEAGCRTISMSIEAGNDIVRKEKLNRHMSNEAIIEAHHLATKYGIKTFTNIIMGIPDTGIKHDIESIDLAIASRVDWIECLIFSPYPGTWLGDYCEQRGYYQPDYAAMHSGYHHRSPLTCFTDDEKRQHLNLTTLGPVAVVLPRLRNCIVNRLMYWRPNKLFLLLYFVVKMRIMRKKLYVTKTSWWRSAWIYMRSLRQEVFKHTEEE